MAYADFKSPFIIHTDASSDGLGQCYTKTRTIKGGL